jgi:hypothetical protein
VLWLSVGAILVGLGVLSVFRVLVLPVDPSIASTIEIAQRAVGLVIIYWFVVGIARNLRFRSRNDSSSTAVNRTTELADPQQSSRE